MERQNVTARTLTELVEAARGRGLFRRCGRRPPGYGRPCGNSGTVPAYEERDCPDCGGVLSRLRHPSEPGWLIAHHPGRDELGVPLPTEAALAIADDQIEDYCLHSSWLSWMPVWRWTELLHAYQRTNAERHGLERFPQARPGAILADYRWDIHDADAARA